MSKLMEQSFSFEWFDRERGVPHIGVFPYGLTLNQAAISALGKPERVELGLDSATGLMAVKPAKGKNGFQVLYNNQPRVNSKTFVKWLVSKGFIIPNKRAVAKWEDNLGGLVVELERDDGKA